MNQKALTQSNSGGVVAGREAISAAFLRPPPGRNVAFFAINPIPLGDFSQGVAATHTHRGEKAWQHLGRANAESLALNRPPTLPRSVVCVRVCDGDSSGKGSPFSDSLSPATKKKGAASSSLSHSATFFRPSLPP